MIYKGFNPIYRMLGFKLQFIDCHFQIRKYFILKFPYTVVYILNVMVIIL